MKKWIWLFAAIGLEVVATLSLRAAMDNPQWFVVVVCGYVGAFVSLSMVLRKGMAIGVAYGIWAACGVALTAVMAHVIFDDSLSLPTAASPSAGRSPHPLLPTQQLKRR